MPSATGGGVGIWRHGFWRGVVYRRPCPNHHPPLPGLAPCGQNSLYFQGAWRSLLGETAVHGRRSGAGRHHGLQSRPKKQNTWPGRSDPCYGLLVLHQSNQLGPAGRGAAPAGRCDPAPPAACRRFSHRSRGSWSSRSGDPRARLRRPNPRVVGGHRASSLPSRGHAAIEGGRRSPISKHGISLQADRRDLYARAGQTPSCGCRATTQPRSPGEGGRDADCDSCCRATRRGQDNDRRPLAKAIGDRLHNGQCRRHPESVPRVSRLECRFVARRGARHPPASFLAAGHQRAAPPHRQRDRARSAANGRHRRPAGPPRLQDLLDQTCVLPAGKAAYRVWRRFRNGAFERKGSDPDAGRFVNPRFVATAFGSKPDETYATLKQHPAVVHWLAVSTAADHAQPPAVEEEGSRAEQAPTDR